MRNLFLLFPVLFSSYQVSAQIATLKGVVKAINDTTAVEYANVTIPELEKKTVSDRQGMFSFSGIPYGVHSVSISSLGYDTLTVEVNMNAKAIHLDNLYIIPKDYVLNEALVKGETRMFTQEGDTTVYNAAAFAIRPDDNAADLLSKMPGVMMDGKKVLIQGKILGKVYLDGRDFVEGVQSSLNNIPAETIDNIQIYDEASRQAQFAGVTDPNALLAANVRTKKPNAVKTIYKVHGGGGTTLDDNNQGLYSTGGNLMLTRPSGRITLLGGLNNINQFIVDQGDGLDDSGIGLGGASGMGIGMNTPGKVIRGGMNVSQDFKKFVLTADYSYNRRKEELFSFSQRSYFPVEGQFDSKEEDNENANVNRYGSNSGLVYLKSQPMLKKNMYELTVRVSADERDSQSSSFNSVMMNGSPVSRSTNIIDGDASGYSVSTNGTWGYRIKEGRTIVLTSGFEIKESNSGSSPAQSLLEYYDVSTSTWSGSANNSYDRLRDESRNNSRVTASLQYTEPLSETGKLSVKADVTYSSSRLQKDVFEYDPITNEYTVVDVALSNDYDNDNLTRQAKLTYDFNSKDKKWSFAVGTGFSKETQKIVDTTLQEDEYEASFFHFKPDLTADFRLSKTARLRLRYGGSSMAPSAQNLINKIDDTSPTYVKVGNPDLKKSFTNQVSISFNDNKTHKQNRQSIYSLSLGFSKVKNGIESHTIIMPVDRDTTLYFYDGDTDGYVPRRGASVSRPVNLNGNYSVNLGGMYGTRLTKLKTNINLRGNYSFSRKPTLYQELNYSNTNNVSGSMSANTDITKDLSVAVSYSVFYMKVTNSLKSKVGNSSTSQNAGISAYYKFWKDITIIPKCNVTHAVNSGTGNSQTNAMLDVGIGKGFKRFKGATVKLTGHNLLNRRSPLFTYVSDDHAGEHKSNMIGRYVMLTFNYNFNSMNTRGVVAQ